MDGSLYEVESFSTEVKVPHSQKNQNKDSAREAKSGREEACPAQTNTSCIQLPLSQPKYALPGMFGVLDPL